MFLSRAPLIGSHRVIIADGHRHVTGFPLVVRACMCEIMCVCAHVFDCVCDYMCVCTCV